MGTAVYPGSFDPITNGHADLVARAAPLFERIIVGVAESPSKAPGFELAERIELARLALASMNRHLIPNVETLFLTPAEQYSFISSSLVREIARLGGDVSGFIHPAVQAALVRKWSRPSADPSP